MSVPLLPVEVMEFLDARERLWRQPPRERYRIGVAMALRNLLATAESVVSTFDYNPDDDDAVGVVGNALGQAIDEANACLVRYRASRDSVGEA